MIPMSSNERNISIRLKPCWVVGWVKGLAIPAEHFAMGDSKGGDRGSPPFGASKSVAFAQHRNKEAFPRFLAGMAVKGLTAFELDIVWKLVSLLIRQSG